MSHREAPTLEELISLIHGQGVAAARGALRQQLLNDPQEAARWFLLGRLMADDGMEEALTSTLENPPLRQALAMVRGEVVEDERDEGEETAEEARERSESLANLEGFLEKLSRRQGQQTDLGGMIPGQGDFLPERVDDAWQLVRLEGFLERIVRHRRGMEGGGALLRLEGFLAQIMAHRKGGDGGKEEGRERILRELQNFHAAIVSAQGRMVNPVLLRLERFHAQLVAAGARS